MIPIVVLLAFASVHSDRDHSIWGSHPLRPGPATVAYSADGTQIVTLTPGGELRTFQATTGERLYTMAIDSKYRDIASLRHPILSADGTTAIILDQSAGQIYVSPPGEPRAWLPTQERRAVSEVTAISGDGQSIATVFRHDIGFGKLRLIRQTDVSPRQLGNIGGRAVGLALNQNGDRVVVLSTQPATDKGILRTVPCQCLNTQTGARLWSRDETFRHAVITPDDQMVLLCGTEKTSPNRLVNLNDGQNARGCNPPPFVMTNPPAISPDGRLLLGMTAEAIVIWDLLAGRELRRIPHRSEPTSWAQLAISPDGKQFTTTSQGLQIWETATGRLRVGPPEPVGHTAPVRVIRFHPNGQELASLAADGSFVRWHRQTKEPLERITGLVGNDLRYGAAAWRIVDSQHGLLTLTDPRTGTISPQPDLSRLVPIAEANVLAQFLTDDGETATFVLQHPAKSVVHTVRWSLKNGAIESEDTQPIGRTNDWLVTISPGGRWEVRASGIRHVKTGSSWEARFDRVQIHRAFGNCLSVPVHMTERLVAANLSTRGGYLASAAVAPEMSRGDYHCLVLEVASARPLFDLLTGNTLGHRLSPDHRVLALLAANEVRFFDMLTRQPLPLTIPLLDTGGLNAFAFSPDGREFVVGHPNGSLSSWRLPPCTSLPLRPVSECWELLGKFEPREGRLGIEPMVRQPDQTLQLLASKLPTQPAPKVADIPALIEQLDSPAFAVRDSANRTLRALGHLAKADLQAASKSTESVELRQRADDLLKAIADAGRFEPSMDCTRLIRCVEVLEAIGSAEAEAMLRALVVQPRDARLSDEAVAALARLKLRNLPSHLRE